SELQQGRLDAIVCDTVFSTVNLPQTTVPIVLNHPDMEHEILLRFAQQTKNPLKKMYALRESGKIREYEVAVMQRARVSLTCSEREKFAMQAFRHDLPIEVVPNAIDITGYLQDVPEAPDTLIYMGGMDWFPNRDAVEFFVADILPRVKAAVPEVEFLV